MTTADYFMLTLLAVISVGGLALAFEAYLAMSGGRRPSPQQAQRWRFWFVAGCLVFVTSAFAMLMYQPGLVPSLRYERPSSLPYPPNLDDCDCYHLET